MYWPIKISQNFVSEIPKAVEVGQWVAGRFLLPLLEGHPTTQVAG